MANDITVNKNTTSGQERWDVSYSVDASGEKTKTLTTAGTLLDRNIKVNVITPVVGTMSLAITDKSTTNITIGTLSGNYYPLTTSLTGTATFSSSGWITTAGASATDNSVTVGRIAAGSIAPTYTNSGLDTYFKSGSSSNYSVYITPQYTNTAGYIPTHSTAVNGDPVYLTIKQAGTMSLNITDKSTTNITVGTKSGNYYPLSTSLTGKATFGSAGWITTNGASATDSSVIVGRIAAASVNISGEQAVVKPIVERTSTNVSGATNVGSGTPTTTAPSSGFFVSIRGKNDTDTTISISSTVTPGYLGTEEQISGSVTAQASTGNIYYLPITGTSINTTNTSVSGTTATRGTATWGAGWITSGSIAAASFSNSATSGTTYVDISSTTAAPMLSSGGYLYINKGYVDNLKISLARLIPDWPSGTSVATANYLLQGYKAYDQDGGILTGTIPTKQDTDVTFNGANITIPKGYFDDNTIVTMQSATLGAEGSVKTPPTASVTQSTSMATTTTDTGYYFQINLTKTNGTVYTKYKATTAGYTPIISAIRDTTGNVTVAPTTSIDGNTSKTTQKIYIKKAEGLVTMTPENGSCAYKTSTNVGTSTTEDNGIQITFEGSGSVSATASVTEGYTPANNSFATGVLTSSNKAQASRWITGVKIEPGSTDRVFKIIVPNGKTGSNFNYIDFRFTVHTNGNVTVDSTGKDLDGTTNLP